jgi:site-specific DNA-adenine methylase
MSFYNDFRPCFEDFLDWAGPEDICFIDPPYILSADLYDMSWTIEDEKALFEYIHKLDSLGVRWMMTNYLYFGEYAHPFIDTITKLYDTKELPRKIDPTPFQEVLGNTKRPGIEYMIVSKRYPFKH